MDKHEQNWVSNILVIVVIAVLFMMMTGCATPATKYSSPVFRVMIDPTGLTDDQYSRLQLSIVQSGKWIVVDRSNGFNAVKREQNRQHINESDRFADREKYARFALLNGAGGVISAQIQCEKRMRFFSGDYNSCHEFLSLLDATTGEVLSVAEASVDSASGFNMMPGWEEVVEKMNHSTPDYLDHHEDDELVSYKDHAEKEAKIKRKHVDNEDEE